MSDIEEFLNNDDSLFMSNKKEKLLRYLDGVLEGLFEEENEIKLNIKVSENRIQEAISTIEITEKQVDPNGIFFTPQVGKRTKFSQSMNEEIIILKEELESLNLKKRVIDEKKSNMLEVISFISETSDNNKTKNESNIKNNTNESDNKYNLSDEMHIKMLETQENERNRIARDIHDTIVQNLTSLVHKAELCTKLVDRDAIRTKLELQTMITTIRNSIDDLRIIIYDLRPMSIDDLGLVATLERHIKNITLKENIKINLSVKNNEVKFQPIISLTIFRVLQEACNNVIKHANAKNINIQIKYDKYNVEITVEDDGIGFNPEDVAAKHKDDLSGLGISIMKERVFLLSGNIMFFNRETGGTKIVITIPYAENNENK